MLGISELYRLRLRESPKGRIGIPLWLILKFVASLLLGFRLLFSTATRNLKSRSSLWLHTARRPAIGVGESNYALERTDGTCFDVS